MRWRRFPWRVSPTAVVKLAPPQVPRYAESAQSTGRAKEDSKKARPTTVYRLGSYGSEPGS
jgi:hypothetical protein